MFWTNPNYFHEYVSSLFLTIKNIILIIISVSVSSLSYELKNENCRFNYLL